MTEYIQKLLERFIVQKEQKQYRQERTDSYGEAQKYSREGLDDLHRAVKRLAFMLESEKPVVYPDEKIALLRTVPTIPEIFTKEEMEEI